MKLLTERQASSICKKQAVPTHVFLPAAKAHFQVKIVLVSTTPKCEKQEGFPVTYTSDAHACAQKPTSGHQTG